MCMVILVNNIFSRSEFIMDVHSGLLSYLKDLIWTALEILDAGLFN